MTIITEKLVRQNIRNVTPYSSARSEFSGNKGVFLDANENPYGRYNRYPDPDQTSLIHQIAKVKNLSPESIIIGNGSDELIDLSLRVFCEPNLDKVMILTPTYGMYEVCAAIHGTPLIKIPLTEDFQIPVNDIKPYFSDKNLKIIFICSPNNPTGNLMRIEDIEYLLLNFDGIVVLDEAYIDFCDQPSFAEKISTYPNLIVLQTMSKAWGLAGLRIGIGIMHPEVITYFRKIKPPYNISSPNADIAIKALENLDLFNSRVIEIIAERDMMTLELSQMKSVKKIYPSDANFILVEVDNAPDLYQKLLKRNIIVRNRHAVIKNTIRITVGSPAENQQLIANIKEVIHG
ncbi:MAG: histidinol-phosphate transaminase [Saprospiraceae bacterium]|nr:histidinol-phosphate transaminase [Saprospiraceae bacterium]